MTNPKEWQGDRRSNESNPTARDWVQWAREAITIIAAAGAAYMGIRVDLARNQQDIDNLKISQSKIELQVEKLRDHNDKAGAR